MEGAWLKTGNDLYHQMARFWTKVFALTFALGVATGIVMEFEFGTNWATYSRFVGDVFGSALAAEGFLPSSSNPVFSRCCCLVGQGRSQTAFFLDVHGGARRAFQRRVDRRGKFVDADARRLSHRRRRDARARGNHGLLATRFKSVLDGPACFTPFARVVRGSFLVVSVSAWYLLKGKHLEFARKSLKVGLTVALAATLLQAVTGHKSAQGVGKNQPAKLAAFEGLYETTSNAPLVLAGWPDEKKQKVIGISAPGCALNTKIAIAKNLSRLSKVDSWGS